MEIIVTTVATPCEDRYIPETDFKLVGFSPQSTLICYIYCVIIPISQWLHTQTNNVIMHGVPQYPSVHHTCRCNDALAHPPKTCESLKNFVSIISNLQFVFMGIQLTQNENLYVMRRIRKSMLIMVKVKKIHLSLDLRTLYL